MKSFTSRPPVRQSPNLTPRSAACLPAGLEIGIPKTNEAASSWPAVARSSNSQPCHLLFSFVILSGAKDLMLPKLDFITNNCDSRHRFQTLSTRQWWSEIQSRGVPVFKDGSRRSSLTTESKGNSKAGCPIHRALCDEWDSTAASFQGSPPGLTSQATNPVVILSGAKDLMLPRIITLKRSRTSLQSPKWEKLPRMPPVTHWF
jgi:hypothetical protein